MKYLDLYWLEMSFNVGFSYISTAEGLPTYGGAERELHIFVGIFAFAIGF